MSPGIIVYTQHKTTPNRLCINQLTTILPLYNHVHHRPPIERPSLNEGKNDQNRTTVQHPPQANTNTQHPAPCPRDNTQHPTATTTTGGSRRLTHIRTHDVYTTQTTENSRIRPVRSLCLPLWSVGV